MLELAWRLEAVVVVVLSILSHLHPLHFFGVSADFSIIIRRGSILVWSAALSEMIASGSADDADDAAGDASASADASVECTRGSSAELSSSLPTMTTADDGSGPGASTNRGI